MTPFIARTLISKLFYGKIENIKIKTEGGYTILNFDTYEGPAWMKVQGSNIISSGMQG
jgi:hypothetical protein